MQAEAKRLQAQFEAEVKEDDGGISDAKTRFKIAAAVAATGLMQEIIDKRELLREETKTGKRSMVSFDAKEGFGTGDSGFGLGGLLEYGESFFVHNEGQWFQDK